MLFRSTRLNLTAFWAAAASTAPPLPIAPFKWKTILKFDDNKSATRQGIIDDLIGAMTIDVHDDLAKAWEAVKKGGMKPEALKKLVSVPITEAEVLNIGKGRWENQEFRNNKISEWSKFAKDKYKEAEKLAK